MFVAYLFIYVFNYLFFRPKSLVSLYVDIRVEKRQSFLTMRIFVTFPNTGREREKIQIKHSQTTAFALGVIRFRLQLVNAYHSCPL